MFAQAALVRQEFGVANLIISSHIPEAMNSAKLIMLAMDNNAQIMEQPRLSRYHAGYEKAFIADFLKQVRHSFSYLEHIILVSHNANIGALTNLHVNRSSSVTLEAQNWSSIFDLTTCRLSKQEDRLAEQKLTLDTISEILSAEVKNFIALLPYVAA